MFVLTCVIPIVDEDVDDKETNEAVDNESIDVGDNESNDVGGEVVHVLDEDNDDSSQEQDDNDTVKEITDPETRIPLLFCRDHLGCPLSVCKTLTICES